MEKQHRNRVATTQRIVDALEQVLTEQGLEGVAIGAIAEKAQVSKVLIYRYFGGLEGLLEYYVGMGRMVPHYTAAWLEQIQPFQPGELASVWSNQSLQLFRQLRASRASRELLKATVQEKDSLNDVVSSTLDTELIRLVDQLAFVEGGDHQATSAVILGALSFLTIQAQNDRPMIGLDLRSEEGWKRIEEVVKGFYKVMAQAAIDSSTSRTSVKPASVAVSTW
jgi:AcrR family transcriptional regulator